MAPAKRRLLQLGAEACSRYARGGGVTARKQQRRQNKKRPGPADAVVFVALADDRIAAASPCATQSWPPAGRRSTSSGKNASRRVHADLQDPKISFTMTSFSPRFLFHQRVSEEGFSWPR